MKSLKSVLCILTIILLGACSTKKTVGNKLDLPLSEYQKDYYSQSYKQGLRKLPGQEGYYIYAVKVRNIEKQATQATQNLSRNQKVFSSIKVLMYKSLLDSRAHGVYTYNSVLKKRGFKSDSEIDLLIALANLQQGKKAYGKRLLKLAAAKSPNDFLLNFNLGIFHYHSHQLRFSEQYFKRCIRSGYKIAPVYIALGSVNFLGDKFDKAEDYFEEALSNYPGHPVALYNLGILERYAYRKEGSATMIFQRLKENRLYPQEVRQKAEFQLSRTYAISNSVNQNMLIMP